jgi:uncharacterized membrane protein YphA (DoxX/SURF4 family)
MVMAALCARFALGAIFIASGILKLGDRASFATAIRAFGPVDPRFVGAVAIALPVAEICCGAAMAVGLFTAVAATVIGALTLIFTGLIIALLARGRAVPCNCFGSASQRVITWSAVLRNACIVGAAVIVYGWSQPVLAVDEIRQQPATTLTTSDAVAALVGTTSGMLASLVAYRLRRLPRVSTR